MIHALTSDLSAPCPTPHCRRICVPHWMQSCVRNFFSRYFVTSIYLPLLSCGVLFFNPWLPHFSEQMQLRLERAANAAEDAACLAGKRCRDLLHEQQQREVGVHAITSSLGQFLDGTCFLESSLLADHVRSNTRGSCLQHGPVHSISKPRSTWHSESRRFSASTWRRKRSLTYTRWLLRRLIRRLILNRTDQKESRAYQVATLQGQLAAAENSVAILSAVGLRTCLPRPAPPCWCRLPIIASQTDKAASHPRARCQRARGPARAGRAGPAQPTGDSRP